MLGCIQLVCVFDSFLVKDLCQWNCYQALHKVFEHLSLCIQMWMQYGRASSMQSVSKSCGCLTSVEPIHHDVVTGCTLCSHKKSVKNGFKICRQCQGHNFGDMNKRIYNKQCWGLYSAVALMESQLPKQRLHAQLSLHRWQWQSIALTKQWFLNL